MIPRHPGLAFASALLFLACLEKPDPASQAAAILSKRPAGFQDRLAALDRLAAEEAALPPSALAESLHAVAVRLGPHLASATSDSQRIADLNAFLFDTLDIQPQLTDTTLAASLPGRVLAVRQGGCVGISLLYLALAARLSLPLVPVLVPGHLFVRWRSDSLARNIETLRRGMARSDSFYRETFSLARRPGYTLADATPDQALAVLVFNLANLHRSRGELTAAREEYRLVLERIPGYPEALGNLGAALLQSGDKDGAREKLQAALAGDSLGQPAHRNLKAHFGPK